MADRPIIFSAPMVRVLLDGRKTQTRRMLTPQPSAGADLEHRYCDGARFSDGLQAKIRIEKSDRLYVREAFTMNPAVRHPDRVKNVIYRADVPDKEPPAGDVLTMGRIMWAGAQELKWKPSIHMPRWASRLTLTVTDVRVQRLRAISALDSSAEGAQCETCTAMGDSACRGKGCFASVEAFRDIWSSIHGPDAWDANPWVVAYSFSVERRNIDQKGGA